MKHLITTKPYVLALVLFVGIAIHVVTMPIDAYVGRKPMSTVGMAIIATEISSARARP